MRCTSLLGLLFAAGAFAVPKAQPFEAAINPLTNPSANERGCGYFRNGKITRPMEGNNRCFSINNEEIQSYVIADGCTCSFFQGFRGCQPDKLVRTKKGPADEALGNGAGCWQCQG